MVEIYLDGANLDAMREGRKNPLVKGFTTNPTLLRQAGVTDYERFAKDALQVVEGLPISFEVFSDEWDDMERQARKIASWGSNVNVKVPVTNTKGESAAPLVRKLSDSGISVNVTAVFTQAQINDLSRTLRRDDKMQCDNKIIISYFAGRVGDAGCDPVYNFYAMFSHFKICATRFWAKTLWASPRQVLDIYLAEKCGADIITVTPDLLKKYEQLKGKDLTEFSRETCRMFYDDAVKANYQL